MTIENQSSNQGSILEKMFEEEKIDATTFIRLKEVLTTSLNEKLKKYNANI
jgi:hypothetical protein